MTHWHITTQSDNEQGINKLWPNIENWYYKVKQSLKKETENRYYKNIRKANRSLVKSASGITKFDRSFLQTASDITKSELLQSERHNRGNTNSNNLTCMDLP